MGFGAKKAAAAAASEISPASQTTSNPSPASKHRRPARSARDSAPDPEDGQRASDPAQERAIAAKLSAVGVGGNVLLAALKFIGGVVGNSAALLSDAVHSLSDVLATAIAYIGVRISKRDADASHPYGHERFECLASLALGLVLAVTGLGIGISSIQSIATGEYLESEAPGAIALVVAAVSILVKEGMFWYTRHWARVLNSSAFMADAWHHRSDALSSVGALLGVGGAMLGLPICDPLASIVICAIILKVAFDVAKDAVDKMVDTPCSAEVEAGVRECIAEVEGVVRIDMLRTRQFGNKIYVDADIAVDGNLPLVQAHAIADEARRAVEARFLDVKDVMVHENPA